MDDPCQYTLFDYWRSSASYRVRIALNLLDLPWHGVTVDLLAGSHRQPEYVARNPQGLVPTLTVDGIDLTQSLAIIEYLNETVPGARLLPIDPAARHRVRSLSYSIAMEIHPICNLSVARHVAELTGGGQEATIAWMQRFIGGGLANVEEMLRQGEEGAFCHGNTPSMADCCLIPQLYNARRWGIELGAFNRICAIESACASIPAFVAAHPDSVRPSA
ncbi:maleylacetoacetate isomerase [Tropicimonas marinistellae]|uniref:maleylacetoacetate isomerase n=1 Tax=Tropicimonas marinistellae TaxID=1739787 RepID=UPI00082F37E1|nr:maleylacetoacetate isomerase [Tropicimonas marinistellae]